VKGTAGSRRVCSDACPRKPLHVFRVHYFLAQHVDDLDGHKRLGRTWDRQVVRALDVILLLLGDVGEDYIEDVTVVRCVNHHAVQHGPPVVDLRRDDAGLLLETLDNGRRDEVLNLDG